MHDPRTSPALRTLADLTGGLPPRRWVWSVNRLDAAGRLNVGRAAGSVLGIGPLRLRWHRLALLVEPDPRATTSRARFDERGRLLVPAWLRQRSRNVVVGLDAVDPLMVIAPVEVLDRFGDLLAGDRP